MKQSRWLRIASVIMALTVMALSSSVEAQTRRPAAKPKPPVETAVQVAVAPQEKCLRALNGACTNPVVVEIARQRAFILPAVQVSYFGTPAGTIGGAYIPFERFFQGNPTVFGLPTFTLFVPGCCIRRSK